MNHIRRHKQKLYAFVDILKSIQSISAASTLKVGCIIFTKNFSKISSIGYNGSYSNAPINEQTGTEEESLEPGKSGFIHAEINAIAKFREINPAEHIVLITHSPCSMCCKVLVNAGFKYIYWLDEYRETAHIETICKSNNVNYGNLEKLIKLYNKNDFK